MATGTATKLIDISKGFATDLALEEREITFLQRAENVIFQVSRAVRKCGGGARLNSTVLTGAGSVLGQFDYWKAGTGGSFSQFYVVTTSDSKVWCELDPSGAAGVFTDVTGGATIGANAIPVFVQANDILTIWWSDGSTPLQFNGIGNVSTLTNAPAGRCACWHGKRMWTWATNANPSLLRYSAYGSITIWTGEDTGGIDIDSEDGDRGVGLASHKNALIAFKGPNKGSIWMITGTTPEGDDGFAEQIIVRGIPLQTHNSIVPIGDDLWFMSERAIHSLSAVARFGDFEEAAITKYLFGYFRDSINRTRLSSVWAVNYALKGCVLFALTNSAGSTNNEALGISYIRPEEEAKPFIWNLSSCQSAGIRINPSTKLREVIFGTNAGFLIRMDQAARIMPLNTSYTGRVTTPSLIVASQDKNQMPRIDQPIMLNNLWLRTQPRGGDDITVRIQRDEKAADSYAFSQGTAAAKFGTAKWGQAQFGSSVMTISEARAMGRCRAIKLDILQSGANSDMDLYEVGIEYVPAAQDHSTALA